MKPVSSEGSSEEGGYESAVKFTSPPEYTGSDDEDGDNSSPGVQNESEHRKPRLGTDRENDDSNDDFGGSCGLPLKYEDIKARFETSARIRFKQSTQRSYLAYFQRFWKEAGFEGSTKRKIAGPDGKKALLAYLEMIPQKSWRFALSAMHAVWIFGLDLSWPIDPRKDLPRLPKVSRRSTPNDDIVRRWHEAMSHESDVYLNLIWMMIAQHGWRPQHLSKIRWRHVQRDGGGKPISIVADGYDEGFKTNAPIAARLCPEVVDLLCRWEKEGPDSSPDRFIVPFRDRTGRVMINKGQSSDNVREQWKRIQVKHSLPPLLPSDMRHFVSSACRRAGLSKQSTAYLQGHDASQGGSMRDWYDSPQIPAALAEQEDMIPNGPLAIIEPVRTEDITGVSGEINALVSQYLNGDLGTFELVSRLEKARDSQRLSQIGIER